MIIMNHRILKKCFQNKKVFIGICISIFLLFFSSFSLDSLNAQTTYQRKKIYGFHNGVAFDITEHSEEQLKNHLSIQQYGEMIIYGEIINGNNTVVGTIGTVDESFQELEQLDFLEGTYPSSTNEIVMESSMLDLLSIPYEVGQKIELSIQTSDGIIQKQTYILSGILKSYTTNWLTQEHSICGAIVSEFNGIPMERHLFFLGDYQNENQMQELNALINEKNESELVYNSYSFVTNATNFYDFFENGSLLLVTSAVSFLILMYIEISTYQKQIYRNRVLLSLGMSYKKLKKRIYLETGKQWFFSWVSVCGISTIICLFLKYILLKQMQFLLTYRPYLLSLLLSFFVVFVTQALQLSILKKLNVVTNGKDISKYSIKHIKRNIDIPFTNQVLLDLEKKRTRKQRMITILLPICTLIILFCGMYNISTTYQSYTWNQKNLGYAYKWKTSSPKNGLTNEQIIQIKNTEGIQSVKYCSKASYIGTNTNFIYFNYKNQEDDPYYDFYLRNKYIDTTEEGLPIDIVLLPEDSNIWNDITDLEDKTSFLNGESVICYFMDLSEMKDGTVQAVEADLKDEVNSTSISIRSGDEISIQADGISTQIKCEKVLNRLTTINVDTNISSGTVFVSEKLYKQLFGLDTIVYNQTIAYGNQNSSYDVTDKLMSMINKNNTITFENKRVEQQEEYSTILLKISYIGGFLLLFSLVVLVQIYRNQLGFYENEIERIQLLKQLGAIENIIQKIYKQNNIRVLIICFLIMNICMIPTIWFLQFHEFSNYVVDGISLTKICKYGLIYTNLWILIIPQVLFIVIYYFLVKKIQL